MSKHNLDSQHLREEEERQWRERNERLRFGVKDRRESLILANDFRSYEDAQAWARAHRYAGYLSVIRVNSLGLEAA